METARIEASRPTVHEAIDFGRVYCPELEKIRPTWLCAMEHGDYHEVMDTEN